VKTEYKICLIF